jgi:hypothetical protein
MLVLVQFSLADARPFVPADTGRIVEPTWPLPNLAKRPFVRGFGQARKRPAGAVPMWAGEGAYCDGSQVIRFCDPIPRRLDCGKDHSSLRICKVHRRLYADGRAVVRIEIGFGIQCSPEQQGVKSDVIGQLLSTLLAGSVRRRSIPTPFALADAGPQLAKAYLRATTSYRTLRAAGHDSWWVTSLAPAIFVSYSEEEVDQLPGGATVVEAFAPSTPASVQVDDVPAANGRSPMLAAWSLRSAGGREDVPIWFIGSRRRVTADARDAARRTRIHLMRLHAEADTLKVMLGHIAGRRLVLARSQQDVDASSRLQWYLKDATALVMRKRREGLSHDAVFDALRGVQGALPVEEPDAVLQLLSQARRSVKAHVAAYLLSTRAGLVVKVTNINAGTLDMSDRTINSVSNSHSAVVNQGRGNTQTTNASTSGTPEGSGSQREAKKEGETPHGGGWERKVAVGTGALVILFVIYLVHRNTPIEPSLVVMMRIVLSLAAATLGATLPGFLDLRWNAGGTAIRAGGALGLFALTYLWSPNVVQRVPTEVQRVPTDAAISISSPPRVWFTDTFSITGEQQTIVNHGVTITIGIIGTTGTTMFADLVASAPGQRAVAERLKPGGQMPLIRDGCDSLEVAVRDINLVLPPGETLEQVKAKGLSGDADIGRRVSLTITGRCEPTRVGLVSRVSAKASG